MRENKTGIITIRVLDEEKKLLVKIASQNKVNLSELVYEQLKIIINKGLQKNGKK